MFEKFNTENMNLAMQPILSLYSINRMTGLVLETGDGLTQIVPIFNAYALHDKISCINLAGRDLTNYLTKMLSDKGYSFDQDLVKSIKEKLCFVAFDFDTEMNKSLPSEASFELPDGKILKIGNELFRTTEPLFRPNLIGHRIKGIHEECYSAIMKCDSDVHEHLFKNIVLTGGNSLFPEFSYRLRKEITSLAQKETQIKIISPSEPKFSAWIGGSVIVSISTYSWINKKDYNESGSSIVHRKCL